MNNSTARWGLIMELRRFTPDKEAQEGLTFFKLVGADYGDPYNPETIFDIPEDATFPIAFEPTEPDRTSNMNGGLFVSPSLRATISDFNKYVKEELKKEDPQPPKVLKGYIGDQYAVNATNTSIKTDLFIVTDVIDWDKLVRQFLRPIHGWDSWEHVREREGVTPGSLTTPPPADVWEDDEEEDEDWDEDDDWELDDEDDDY